jgi:DNA-3-methyladenine glycosylase II
MPAVPDALTPATLQAAVRELAARDPDLRGVVERIGPPPLWERPPGFPTLVHIILEQQVSLASAKAAFDRLGVALDPLSPERFLELDDAALLAIGFSRQKARYVRALSRALVDGSLDLETIETLDDDGVERALVAIPGIGPWTATIYRLMVLRRPDAWPTGDIALAESLGRVKGLGRRPTPDEMPALAEPWRPWRGVAARILWHDYLDRQAMARAARAARPPDGETLSPSSGP